MFLLSSKNENISPLSSSYARTNESMNTLRKCEVSWFSWISPKSIKINQSTLFVWVFCFVCMYVLCVPHMCRPEELALQLLWASIELCELNLGPLKEQLVIWTIEPSLQPATIGGGGFHFIYKQRSFSLVQFGTLLKRSQVTCIKKYSK